MVLTRSSCRLDSLNRTVWRDVFVIRPVHVVHDIVELEAADLWSSEQPILEVPESGVAVPVVRALTSACFLGLVRLDGPVGQVLVGVLIPVRASRDGALRCDGVGQVVVTWVCSLRDGELVFSGEDFLCRAHFPLRPLLPWPDLDLKEDGRIVRS